MGGIVGQAEPYIAVDLSEDIVRQLSDHIDTMHDQIGKMLDDAGDRSDILSNRLSRTGRLMTPTLWRTGR